MNEKLRFFVTLVLCVMPFAVLGQTTQLKVATISTGAARLNNGSVINIGQPLVGAFGSTQAGIGGNGGIVSALRRAELPPQLSFHLSVVGLSGTILRYRVEGPPNATVFIQVSSDLVNWSEMSSQSISADGSVTGFDLLSLGQSARFYRAVLR